MSEQFDQALAAWSADTDSRKARWTVAHGPLPCRHCPQTIGAGEPYRLVTRQNFAYCTSCAKDQFQEAPPTDLPALPIVQQVASATFGSRFTVDGARDGVRQERRDVRMQQVGPDGNL